MKTFKRSRWLRALTVGLILSGSGINAFPVWAFSSEGADAQAEAPLEQPLPTIEALGTQDLGTENVTPQSFVGTQASDLQDSAQRNLPALPSAEREVRPATLSKSLPTLTHTTEATSAVPTQLKRAEVTSVTQGVAARTDSKPQAAHEAVETKHDVFAQLREIVAPFAHEISKESAGKAVTQGRAQFGEAMLSDKDSTPQGSSDGPSDHGAYDQGSERDQAGTTDSQKALTGGKSKTPTLDAYGRDLNQLARDNKLDPVIGRAAEIERAIQILGRRTKNNPVLIGEPGVGKTAIAEGIAQRIISGNIPESLRDKRVITLDLAGLVAGTKYRGEFEERMKRVMDEVRGAQGEIILFIDELHTLVGAGAAEGAVDASNIIKPALARGELQAVGATTLNEYRKHIEKDAALERRFQPIIVDEPSVADSIEMLKGLRSRYEAHHKVKISDEALEQAAKLSNRYITDRFLPDKAIDLIDEASARVRTQANIPPTEITALREQLRDITREKEKAVKTQDFSQSATLRERESNTLQELRQLEHDWKITLNEKLKNLVVTGEDIAHIVSSWTKIPTEQLNESERERLLKLGDILHQRIIGQNDAVDVVVRAIRRQRVGLRNPNRPAGSFIFLGPTGVGKTEVARAVAEFLFGNEDALIKLDMSEYMEKYSVSRLTGAPPGYVGYEEGGQLTEAVRRKPYSVVLLDEIEKAHPDVFNLLLQVLDDGRLTDSQGRHIDFKNAIIIMTSNLGGGAGMTETSDIGFRPQKNAMTQEQMDAASTARGLQATKETFRPEFLNRVDETVVFKSLTPTELHRIFDLKLAAFSKNKSITLLKPEISAQNWQDYLQYMAIVEPLSWNTKFFGARPLERMIQRTIEDPLSEDILSGKLHEGDTVQIGYDAANHQFTFKQISVSAPTEVTQTPQQ